MKDDEIEVMWCPGCFGWNGYKRDDCKMCGGKEHLFFSEAIIKGIPIDLWEGNKFITKRKTYGY